MLNNKGYSIKEMVILCSVLAVFFGIGIAKTSYAYSNTVNNDEILASEEENLLTVAKLYVEANKDKFTETETYFYGKDLITNHYILSNSESNAENTKIKVTLAEETYQVELVK